MGTIAPRGNTPLLPGTLKNLFFPPEKGEYTYFARADMCPYVGGSSIVKAAWAADASMLCYARYGANPMPDAEFRAHVSRSGIDNVRKIGNWSGPGTQGFFASNDSFA